MWQYCVAAVAAMRSWRDLFGWLNGGLKIGGWRLRLAS